MEFLVLGDLEIRDGDTVIALNGRRPRSLLAALALNANRVVQPGVLMEAVWPDGPPATAANTYYNQAGATPLTTPYCWAG